MTPPLAGLDKIGDERAWVPAWSQREGESDMRRTWIPAHTRRWLAVPMLALTFAGPARSESKRPPLEEWFPRLRKGQWVKVEGSLGTGNALRAREIKVLRGDLDAVEINSTIAVLDAAKKTFTTEFGIQVVTNHRTEFQLPDHSRGTFALLQPGVRIEAEVQLQKDGTLLADEVEIKTPDAAGTRHREKDEITGRIDALDPTAHRFGVLGVTVECDDRTKNKTAVQD
jgi:hypothetical protein